MDAKFISWSGFILSSILPRLRVWSWLLNMRVVCRFPLGTFRVSHTMAPTPWCRGCRSVSRSQQLSGYSTSLYRAREQIFAVRLMRVKFRSWTPDVSKAHLGKNSYWRMASDNRSFGGDSEEIIEAFLEEHADGEEEVDEPGGFVGDTVDFHII